MRLMPEVRYALRRWRRRPGFAVTAILTLSFGIAAATAIFSVVDAVLLRPLPWPSPDQLVVIHGVYPDRRVNPATAATWNRGTLSFPAWDALRTTAVFQTVGVWRPSPRPDMTFGEARTAIVRTLDVSANFLPMLGTKMAMGRHFTEREDTLRTDSIILSHETWQSRFGARRDVIGARVMLGSAITLDHLPKTVVGVLEPGFRFAGESPEILLPVGNAPFSGSFRVVARLAPAVSREAAESAAIGVVKNTDTRAPVSVRVVQLEEEYLGSARLPLWLLFAGAGMLLLVACSNVAGLLLGEARMRRHEMAVRAALGGSRARVVRQLLVEHALMAGAGAAIGLVFARWLIGWLVVIAPEGVPRLDTVTMDLRVAAFALMIGALTVLVFGVVPALSLARTPVAGVLAEGGRDGSGTRHLGQRAVVIGEIALALVLLVGAGLFGETIFRITSQPLGFEPKGLVIVSTTFTGDRFGDPSTVRQAQASNPGNLGAVMDRLQADVNNSLTDRVLERVSALPGVSAAAGAGAVPFVAPPLRVPIVIEGRPDTERHDVLRQSVSERYFDAMRMPITDGNGFGPAARTDERVAVISREFQRRFFPGSAIGRRFRHVYGATVELSVTYRIIGVVPDVKRTEFTDDERPAFYMFDRQAGGITHFLARTSGDPFAMLRPMRQAIGEVSPQLVVTSMTSLEERVMRSVAEERFRATLSAAFGAMALGLAAVGLYGLAARRVADRRREFAVRMALGARPADIGGLVLRDAVVIVLLGLLTGLPAALTAVQVTRTLLFGVTPTSPHVFALTAATLALVALTATFLPARRASQADPIRSLRA
jgi:putative ABC transport system permease protein